MRIVPTRCPTEPDGTKIAGETPRWRRDRFSDFEDMAERVREFGYDFVRLENGPMEAQISRIELDRVVMVQGIGDFPRHSVRSCPDRPALLFTTAVVGDAVWSGHPIDDSSLLSFGADIEVVGSTRGHLGWIGLFWEAEVAEAHAAALGIEATCAPDVIVKAPTPQALSGLRAAITGAFELGATNPGALDEPALRRSIEQSVLTAAVDATHPPQDRRSVASVSHARAVRAAFRVLEARVGDPIYLAELCEAANVSERTLLYGESPSQTLRTE